MVAAQTRRSAFQCLQQFQQHNKALRRRAWTAAEDRMLTQLVQEMRVGNHIPYRRSESAPSAGPPTGGGVAERRVAGDLEEEGSVLPHQGSRFHAPW